MERKMNHMLYKRKKKFRNPKISELSFGGDKRDRTAGLLNAIQDTVVKFKHFRCIISVF